MEYLLRSLWLLRKLQCEVLGDCAERLRIFAVYPIELHFQCLIAAANCPRRTSCEFSQPVSGLISSTGIAMRSSRRLCRKIPTNLCGLSCRVALPVLDLRRQTLWVNAANPVRPLFSIRAVVDGCVAQVPCPLSGGGKRLCRVSCVVSSGFIDNPTISESGQRLRIFCKTASSVPSSPRFPPPM